jgi:hypothetical protein
LEQCLSGNPGASFDRNRVPNSPVASGQHAARLTIDTACHWLRGGADTGDCRAGAGALIDLLHMNRLSNDGDRIGGPAAYAGEIVRQTDRVEDWRLVSRQYCY